MQHREGKHLTNVHECRCFSVVIFSEPAFDPAESLSREVLPDRGIPAPPTPRKTRSPLEALIAQAEVKLLTQ